MTTTGIDTHLTDAELERQLRKDVRAGLSGTSKTLPPKWFYDAYGSELFERITRLPEYYPARTERGLLNTYAERIARVSRAETLVELGSGSSEKTRLLLSAFAEQTGLKMYVPQDVSESAIRLAADALAIEFPDLAVHGVVGDFTDSLAALPGAGRRLVAFLGGTIGNFDRAARAEFLDSLAAALDPGEHVLIGIGLATDPVTMVAAYDDADGVTAEFNRNVLRVMNARLRADFDPDAFDHVADWNADAGWIEMRLRARRPMRVAVPELDMTVDFADGEEMRTEVSAKFTVAGFSAELASAGLNVADVWTDPDGRFALVLGRAW